MDWYDVDNVLFDGNAEDIQQLKCPDCGGRIHFEYRPVGQSLKVMCRSCGYFSIQHSDEVPNCYKLFGEEFSIA